MRKQVQCGYEQVCKLFNILTLLALFSTFILRRLCQLKVKSYGGGGVYARLIDQQKNEQLNIIFEDISSFIQTGKYADLKWFLLPLKEQNVHNLALLHVARDFFRDR